MTGPAAHVPHQQHQHHRHHDEAGAGLRLSRGATRLTLLILIPAAVLTLVGLVWLWPGGLATEPFTGPPNRTGQVLAVQQIECADPVEPDVVPGQAGQACGTVVVALRDGPDAGQRVTTALPSGPGAPTVKVGDTVILIQNESFTEPGTVQYDIIDHERGPQLWLMLAIFALTVVAFGRWRGVKALLGLAVTFAALLLFVVPAILQGTSPLLVAIVGSSAIMLVVLYLTHGFNTPTSMAVLGTLASLALAGALAVAAAAGLKLTGVADEQASYLTIAYGKVDMLGLLLAGIIIGALGVLDDVTVTQAYTVSELAAANPEMGFGRLYRAASRVGRAHITSVINTIVLAYAGASLPLLLLLAAGPGQSAGGWAAMLKSELLTQEIVRSVVGTLGLIAAVPITTALAAFGAQGGRDRSGARAAGGRRRRADRLEVAWGLSDDSSSGAVSGSRG